MFTEPNANQERATSRSLSHSRGAGRSNVCRPASPALSDMAVGEERKMELCRKNVHWLSRGWGRGSGAGSEMGAESTRRRVGSFALAAGSGPERSCRSQNRGAWGLVAWLFSLGDREDSHLEVSSVPAHAPECDSLLLVALPLTAD